MSLDGIQLTDPFRASPETKRYFQPFFELNWTHNSKRHGIQMDSTKVELAGAENIAEMKLGLEANLFPQGSIRVNTAVQIGNKSITIIVSI
ncbi:autotransporter outer membrane beta-barrel domain-containing protein [Rosenbergiella sp. S61]|uniref:Autotransporter outer membrane beta-barrel domain-containing protein n=1 Tax=Rosenbergiella gaditana TaxID=2726987 RepID=A0ABS5SXA1_9GAMM|nr:autotransporter outer membrane beta-barrel domain-containing protein [Rosenbergiella gaditana]